MAGMSLPLRPPIQPMLARAAKTIPDTADLLFEPKWDGFRCLVFRDGADVVLQSRTGRPLTRYFPELVKAAQDALPERVILDGEIVLVVDGRLDWDKLTERVHPAASRITLLSTETPAMCDEK